jgi:hypothetical protein
MISKEISVLLGHKCSVYEVSPAIAGNVLAAEAVRDSTTNAQT